MARRVQAYRHLPAYTTRCFQFSSIFGNRAIGVAAEAWAMPRSTEGGNRTDNK